MSPPPDPPRPDRHRNVVRPRAGGRQFPHWAGLPLESIDSGGVLSAIYRLGSQLAVRRPLRAAITTDVLREQAKLVALAPFLPVTISAVEAPYQTLTGRSRSVPPLRGARTEGPGGPRHRGHSGADLAV